MQLRHHPGVFVRLLHSALTTEQQRLLKIDVKQKNAEPGDKPPDEVLEKVEGKRTFLPLAGQQRVTSCRSDDSDPEL